MEVGSMLKIQPSLGGPSEYRSYLDGVVAIFQQMIEVKAVTTVSVLLADEKRGSTSGWSNTRSLQYQRRSSCGEMQGQLRIFSNILRPGWVSLTDDREAF